MSHFTKVATKINSIPALMRALDSLGYAYEVDPNGGTVTVLGYMHEQIDAQLGIKIPGTKYGIGVVRATLPGDAGTYELAGDWWGIETTTGKAEREIVDSIGAAYSLARVQIACEEAGYTFEGEPVRNEDGTVQLTAVAWS